MSHQSVLSTSGFHSCLKLKGFKAYTIDRGHSLPAIPAYGRRDLYKLYLITTKSRICDGEHVTEIDGSILFYASPDAFYSWESIFQAQSGYSCLFSEEFLRKHPQLAIFLQSPIFGLGNIAVCPLNQEQNKRVTAIFRQILSAQESGYIFKHELISSCLHLLIHEMLQKQPSENY